MEGVAERARRAAEGQVAQAWWTENFNGAGNKLRPLKHYLEQLKPKRPLGERALEAFQEFQRRGAKITITRIPANGAD